MNMETLRRKYLDALIELIGTKEIKVITGIRRCGKSVLLKMFKEHVVSSMEHANVIDIDFTLLENENLLDYHELYKYIKSHFIEECVNFLIIDEVQMCDNFEKVINSLYTEEGYDIYLTGSNAFLLSSDLATLFTGRSVEIEVFPFSYKEYIECMQKPNPLECFDEYVLVGGMPGSYSYINNDRKLDYIRSVYETIIQRDLVKRKKIRNKVLLNKIADFLMDNISSITSNKKITNALNNSALAINDKTVSSYVDNLTQAFLFYCIRRYDIKGKKYLASQEKYYLVDPCFKYALLGTKDMNYGRIYENIIAIELLRRGYDVFVGTLYKTEVDFVAMKRDKRIYIQVSDDISNEDTFNREVASLLKINDGYPKFLIARTKHPMYNYEGIKIIDFAEWLYIDEE